MASEREERLKKIQKVLVWTFVMNVGVCALKIALGLFTGIFAIAADGFHSLGDSFSNVIGFLGIRLARKAPDNKFGYGYDKFESIATLLIVSLTSIAFYQVMSSGIERLINPEPVVVHPFILAIMLVSMAVNVLTIRYEGGAGKRLKSELLIADSSETRSDLWVSGTVIIGMVLISVTGWSRMDGLLSVIVGLFILKIIKDIVVPTAKVLADAQAVPPEEIAAIVETIPGVKFCHAVRSHGRAEGFFVDLHLGVDKNITVEDAHDVICHKVKLALHDGFPNLKSANIHIEPDSEEAKTREKSVFKKRDTYGHSG